MIIFIAILLSKGYAFSIDTSFYRFHTKQSNFYPGGIRGIVKDKLGRMWYNGKDVLFVYDGYTSYSMDEAVIKNAPAASWNYNKLFVDEVKNLYLTTNRGLLQFDYDKVKFNILTSSAVRFITSDLNRNLWIVKDDEIASFPTGQFKALKTYPIAKNIQPNYLACIGNDVFFTEGDRIFKLDKRNGENSLFASLDKPSTIIQRILEYRGQLYVLTYQDGLFILSMDGKLKKRIHIPSHHHRSTIAKDLWIDKFNTFWIATQVGLFLYHPEDGTSMLLRNKLGDRYSIPQNSVWAIYPDPDGGFWIGTFGGGIAYQTFNDNHVKHVESGVGKLNNSIVSCFEEDTNGNIWIGTEGGGVNFWDRSSDTFSYPIKPSLHTSGFSLIKTLKFDNGKKNLYVSAFEGGIKRYNLALGQLADLNIKSPLNPTTEMSIYDYAWEGTQGLWMADPDDRLYFKSNNSEVLMPIVLKTKKGTLISKGVECVFRDSKHFLWLFTHNGLYTMDVNTKQIVKEYFIPHATSTVNHLQSYFIGSQGDMWVGTSGGGVNLLTSAGEYKNFNVGNGFPAKVVFGILEDLGSGDIWFSTDVGIVSYSYKDRKFKKCNIITPGICGSFYNRSCYRTSKGELLFGGTRGFIIFNPAQMKSNEIKPRVYFTDLFINKEKTSPEIANSPLNKDFSMYSFSFGQRTKEDVIVLNHDQSNIEVKFSSNNYLLNERNKFAYRLVGLSDQWQELSEGQNSLRLFNLPAGEFILELKAANNDGIWSDLVSTLYFKIKPSPFLSGWAFGIYAILFLAILYLLWRYFTNKKIFANQLELERQKEENLKELIQLRTSFFTSISHDLKTPLTLVTDPLSRLKEHISSEHSGSKYLVLIERNLSRIKRMISQLLMFREIESKSITLYEEYGDLVGYIKSIFSQFEPFAHKKAIETVFTSFEKECYLLFDHDAIEKIFSNLFSNAIKYTPSSGEQIIVKITAGNMQETTLNEIDSKLWLTFEVTNTGIEISEEKQQNLFKSFSRLSGKRPAFEESTGLGLSIVKELTDILSGNVELVSSNNRVVFHITIPFLRNENSGVPFSPKQQVTEISEIEKMVLIPNEIGELRKQRRKKHSLVVIEDDPVLRGYMEKELAEHYNVYVSANGKEGIELVQQVYPSVVVTDLIMPEANGFEVCEALRLDISTSHIPIIILSALGGNTQHKVKGLEKGADVFIEKPFDMSFLLQQVANMITSRNKLKEVYSKKYTAEPSKFAISSIDEQLLDKAMTYIENNMDNPSYDVDAFVADMGIGRTLLYRKISDIVGMSIKEFIRDIRLKRAAQLLNDSEYTVSQVAYMTGFNEAKHFGVSFKKKFNVAPSDFKKSNK